MNKHILDLAHGLMHMKLTEEWIHYLIIVDQQVKFSNHCIMTEYFE